MIQPIRFSDDPLMRDIPETATKFEYGNMVIAMLHPEKKELDWLIINKENPQIHYHIYQKKGEVYFLKTHNFKTSRKKHELIDIEESMKMLGKMLTNLFSKAERIYLDDKRFANEVVYFLVEHKLYVKGKTKNKVIFDQNYDVEEVSFCKIDVICHKLGFVFDKNNNEKDLVFVQNGSIFRLEIKHFEEIQNFNSFF